MGICSTKTTIFDIDIHSIEKQSYNNQFHYCRIDNVYDGDTADIYFRDGNKVVRNRFRFYGYDSAEMKPPKKIENREEIKNQAILDKQHLSSLVSNSKLIVEFQNNEKYGRMMGKVWRVNNINHPERDLKNHPELIEGNYITFLMIQSGHGKPYFGGLR